jgi:signal transduction histidine kinase/CheY-like chemotaxis protein
MAMRRFSIRSLLGVSLLLLVILPCLTMAWWLVQRAPAAVEELASRALQDAARRAQSDSQAHLMNAYRALDGLMPENRTTVRTAQALAWVSDPALFAPMAFALTRASSDLRFVYYRSEAGAVHGVENAADGFRFGGRGAVDSGARSFTQRASDEPLKFLTAEGESPDPRGQPWYDAALRAEGRVVSPVSVYPASKQLVVTLSQPVHDGSGRIAGVLGADLSLQALTGMLNALPVSPRAVAFLVDEKGMLLASSADALPAAVSGGEAGLRSPRTSASPLVRASYESLERLWSGAPAARLEPASKAMRMQLAGDLIFVTHANVGDDLGLKWKLVVAAPEGDFSSATAYPLDFVLPALALVVLAGLLLSSLGARHLERQFAYLGRAVDQLANGAVPALTQPTRIREFSQLAVSLRECSLLLNESGFDALSEAVTFSDTVSAYVEPEPMPDQAIQQSPEQVETKLQAPAPEQMLTGMSERRALDALKCQLLDRTLELAAMRDRAMAATRSKAAFLAVISHELRTPLNGVVGMISLLSHTALNNEQHEYLQSLTVSSNQLQQVVEEILEFSRSESGELVLEMAPFEVRKVLKDACDRAAKAAHAKGLKLVLEIPGRVQQGDAQVPWLVSGDATRLSQVFTHLVSNAVKFTDSGTITVQVRPLGGESALGLPMLEVRVLDSGLGIAADQLRNVFLAFTQLDSSISRKHGGTGLGLATCKRLVELMGGQIGVESKPGAGSTFWFTALAPWAEAGVPLPAPLVEESGEAWLQGASVNHRQEKPTILVVDDNPINLKVACAMLLKFGYPILTAEGGREAIGSVDAAIGRGEKIGAVLMDVHMPDVDGIQATSAIRAMHGDQAPPIIALTAGSAVDDKQRCLDVGMVEYLPKPLQLSALAKSLERWVWPHAAAPAKAIELPQSQSQSQSQSPLAAVVVLTEPAQFESFSDADIAMPTGLVDFDRLNDFKEFDDPQLSMTREVIGLLFSEVPVQLSAIERAILQGDVASLISAAHSLRGAASNVGAVTVQHLCSVLERYTLELQAVPPDASACLVALRIAWSRTRPLLENWR